MSLRLWGYIRAAVLAENEYLKALLFHGNTYDVSTHYPVGTNDTIELIKRMADGWLEEEEKLNSLLPPAHPEHYVLEPEDIKSQDDTLYTVELPFRSFDSVLVISKTIDRERMLLVHIIQIRSKEGVIREVRRFEFPIMQNSDSKAKYLCALSRAYLNAKWSKYDDFGWDYPALDDSWEL
jgi:hypothetical protein